MPKDGKVRLLLEFDPLNNVFGVGTNCNAYPVLVGLLEVGRGEVDKMVNIEPIPVGVQG